jgi:hypothetical protein
MTIMPELTSLDLIHTMEVLEELVRITEKKSMSGDREKIRHLMGCQELIEELLTN